MMLLGFDHRFDYIQKPSLPILPTLAVFAIVCHTIFVPTFLGGAVWHVGSYFPDQGLNPHPLHWKRRVLTTGPPGKSPVLVPIF